MNTFAACSGHQAMTKYFEREGGGETNTMILGTIKILFDHLSISITFKKIKELFLEKPFISSKSQTACQLLCPWGFSRQEYWNGLLCPPPGDLPRPGIKPRPPALLAYSLPSEPTGKPLQRSSLASAWDLSNPGIEPRSPELQTLYQLRRQGSPRILERAAYPFSRGSS